MQIMKCPTCEKGLYLLTYITNSKDEYGKYKHTKKSSKYIICDECKRIFKIEAIGEEK